MGLIREPKNVDFSQESLPWDESELRDFRKVMSEIKTKNLEKKIKIPKIKKTLVLSTK